MTMPRWRIWASPRVTLLNNTLSLSQSPAKHTPQRLEGGDRAQAKPLKWLDHGNQSTRRKRPKPT